MIDSPAGAETRGEGNCTLREERDYGFRPHCVVFVHLPRTSDATDSRHSPGWREFYTARVPTDAVYGTLYPGFENSSQVRFCTWGRIREVHCGTRTTGLALAWAQPRPSPACKSPSITP